MTLDCVSSEILGEIPIFVIKDIGEKKGDLFMCQKRENKQINDLPSLLFHLITYWRSHTLGLS